MFRERAISEISMLKENKVIKDAKLPIAPEFMEKFSKGLLIEEEIK